LEKLKFLITPLPTYMPLFGLGIWVASLAAGKGLRSWEQRIVRWAPIGVVTTLLVVVAFSPMNAGLHDTKWFLLRLTTWGPFCFFLVLAATQEGRIRRIFSWQPLVWAGTFSYSLYLIHQPFLQMAAALILPHHWSTGLVLLCQIVILPMILVGFGYLFFLAFEKPFLRRPVRKAIEAEQHGLQAGSLIKSVS
jgi:peptidoglycan/LPS O-acetylase OafA/YrhL